VSTKSALQGGVNLRHVLIWNTTEAKLFQFCTKVTGLLELHHLSYSGSDL
jgi:hypothetical protein